MGEYSNVDLSALDEVVRKLNTVLKDMQATKGKAAHSTYLPAGALGSGFQEEQELRGQHNTMKTMIEDQMLAKLEDLIDDFGKKTSKALGHYTDNEVETTNALSQT